MKENLFLRVHLSFYTSGLAADLKPTNIAVFQAICSFMNEKGECYPTHEQIAERSGVTSRTVQTAVQALCEFRVQGKPILTRHLVKRGKYKNTVYKVHPISQLAIFNGEIETIQQAKESHRKAEKCQDELKPYEVLSFYEDLFREVYGVNPSISKGRDLSLIKKNLIGSYTDEEIKKMIEISILEYDQRLKKPSYLRPTLSMICSWLGVQALGVAHDKEKEFKEIQAMTADTDLEAEAAAALARLSRGKRR